ncbi:hypothetical protein N656DRAFT_802967 [Canariomyces notabilis]|uniref:Uncharacterized protein n=1 Tax=Canariomyces notabilis TaxID=2074819 RepID=A0AAN6QE49_9PEZI|nr:hypothetical protein N656DRAFT_802967 [Canariomyces arenarius]
MRTAETPFWKLPGGPSRRTPLRMYPFSTHQPAGPNPKQDHFVASDQYAKEGNNDPDMDIMMRLKDDLECRRNSLLGTPRDSPSPVAEEEDTLVAKGGGALWGHALLLTTMDGGKTSSLDWADRLNSPGANETPDRVKQDESESDWDVLESEWDDLESERDVLESEREPEFLEMKPEPLTIRTL